MTPLLIALSLFPSVETAHVPFFIGIQKAAIKNELMDPLESFSLFFRPEDFTHDVIVLWKRYRQLNDAPPLCDAVRFPGRDQCRPLMTQNRQLKQYLLKRAKLGPSLAGDAAQAAEECQTLYETWVLVQDASCVYFYNWTRRIALKKLRDRIGYPMYYAGCLPPHVPVWRLNRKD